MSFNSQDLLQYLFVTLDCHLYVYIVEDSTFQIEKLEIYEANILKLRLQKNLLLLAMDDGTILSYDFVEYKVVARVETLCSGEIYSFNSIEFSNQAEIVLGDSDGNVHILQNNQSGQSQKGYFG